MCIYSIDKGGGNLLIFIDNKSGVPIYDQICSRIKELILNGELKADDMLPSIRTLAKELRISVITTKRAYEELEKEGFVYTVPAKGCFVANKDTDLIREQNLRRIEELFDEIIPLAKSCRLSYEELEEILKAVSEDKL